MTPITRAVAIALENGMRAKEQLTKDEGVGSDLIPSVYGFDDKGQPIGYAALIEGDNEAGSRQLVEAALVMRRAWGCSVVAFLVEGYTSSPSDDPRSLVERYPTDDDVNECLTIHAASSEGDSIHAVQPYTVTVPRRVVWHEPLMRHHHTPVDGLTKVVADILSSVPHEPWVWSFSDGFGALSDLGFVAVGDEHGWTDEPVQ